MKEVTVEELRKNLDEILTEAKAGESITIVRDGQPIASLRPTVTIVQRGVRYPFRDLKISPLSKPFPFDPIDGLIEERERERSGKKYGL
jgi:prevent-host-death family protein